MESRVASSAQDNQVNLAASLPRASQSASARFAWPSEHESSLGWNTEVTKISQVAPASFSRLTSHARSFSSAHLRAWISFYDAYGSVGPLLVVILLISIFWTAWLIVLTIAPNATANFLMNTGEYDGGEFWLIVDPDHTLQLASVVGLAVVDAAYVFVLWKMISWKTRNFVRNTNTFEAHHKMPGWLGSARALFLRARHFWRDLAGIRGRYRKFWNICLKTIDLALQSVVLHQLLDNGFSVVLVTCYAAFLCANSLSAAANILWGSQSALNEIFIDSIFDLIAAVLYPIMVLIYCCNTLDFDRGLFNVYLEVLPPGSFEHSARLFVDPAERALFLASLNSLRVLSLSDLVLRLSMNLAFCHRFNTVIGLVIEISRAEKSGHLKWQSLSRIFQQQRRVPRPLAIFFVAFGAIALGYSQGSIASSKSVCAPYPGCVVYAYEWGAKSCSCRTFVDVDRTPLTYGEWMEPIDVSHKVKALSAAGKLQNLQLINRALRTWPDELRRCKSIQFISLIYTETEVLPDYAKDWNELQFLHIEGKQLRPALTLLQDDLFQKMPHLQMIHLGVHPQLPRIPPLEGVPNLKSLTLACLYAVTKLPSVEKVPKLQIFELAYMFAVRTLPDLAPLKNLRDLMIFSICEACCNGFIGSCDLSDPFCAGNDQLSLPTATCLSESEPRPSSASKALFLRFSSRVCSRSGFDSENAVDLLSKTRIEVCGGVPYQRCEYPQTVESLVFA